MFNKLKKVTAVVTAGALVAGTFALNANYLSDGLVRGVNAATIMDYDSANSINYSAVLGRAVDFGILSNVLEQNGHMETNFAVNEYIHI